MSITYALLSAALFFGILALIGHATFRLLLPRLRIGQIERLGLAPALGLAVFTLIVSYLVLINVPLEKISVYIAIFLGLLAILILAYPCEGTNKLEVNRQLFLIYLFPLGVIIFFIGLPFVLGGYSFSILRGNGSDSFNYVVLADALMRHPIDWLLNQSKEVLNGISPNLSFAQDLVKTRFSTSALLAFTSAVFQISPLEFEYAFTLTLLIILGSSLIACISAIGVLTRLSAWLVVAFICGFWGQFILDLRAFSQLISMPLVVFLLAWLLPPLENSGDENLFRYGVPITAIVFTATFFQYPEILFAYFPAILAIFVLRIWRVKCKLIHHKSFLASCGEFLILLFLFAAPLLKAGVEFLGSQVTFATKQSLGWENAYFSWMKNPITGIWGLGSKLSLGNISDVVFPLLGMLAGIMLTIILLAKIFYYLKNVMSLDWDNSELSVMILAISAILGSIFLYAQGNPWSAGKVVSFFSPLIPVVLAIWLSRYQSFSNSIAVKLIFIAVILWISLNLAFGGARIIHSIHNSQFANYINGHGEFGRVKAKGMQNLQNYGCPTGSTVAVFDPSVWGREFRTHWLEGNRYRAVTPGFPMSRRNLFNINMPISEDFDCVLSNSSTSYFSISGGNTIERSTDLLVPTRGRDFLALANLEGGYGVELNKETSQNYIFTGIRPITITLFGRGKGQVLKINMCAVGERKAEDSLKISIEADGAIVERFKLDKCKEKFIQIDEGGENFIKTIKVINEDSRQGPVLIGKDPRDLRLRVDILGFGRKNKIPLN